MDASAIAQGDSVFGAFSLIGQLWLYKVLVCVLPGVSLLGMGAALSLFLDFLVDSVHAVLDSHRHKIRRYRHSAWNEHNTYSPGHPTQAELDAIAYPRAGYAAVLTLKL